MAEYKAYKPLHEKTYNLVKIFCLYIFAQKLPAYLKCSSSEI